MKMNASEDGESEHSGNMLETNQIYYPHWSIKIFMFSAK